MKLNSMHNIVALTIPVVAVSLWAIESSFGSVPSVVLAKPFWGIAYGPYRAGQSPVGGPHPTREEIEADMPRLAALASNIRTYGVQGTLGEIPSAAGKHNLQVWLGAWIDRDPAANDLEVDRLLEVAQNRSVAAVVVGNECLLRKVPIEEVVRCIRAVRRSLSKTIPIAYSDTAALLVRNSQILSREIDVVMPNIHPFWGKQDVISATTYVAKGLSSVTKSYPGKQVVLGEVGWPSDGKPYGAAKPGGLQQRQLISQLIRSSKARNSIKTFVFEAFDEPFKIEGDGIGAHWGVLMATGATKPSLLKLLPAITEDPTRSKADNPEPVIPGLIVPTDDVLKVFMGEKLSKGFDMGVATSGNVEGWVTLDKGVMKCAYPKNQDWGTVFITVGKPVPLGGTRRSMDLSNYKYLVLEIRGATGNEKTAIGMKTVDDPDDGSEPKHKLSKLSREWKELRIPLAEFSKPPKRLKSIYVPFELVFEDGDPAQTVYIRNIRFEH